VNGRDQLPVTILDVMTDSGVFGRWFANASWSAWKVVAAAIFALPLSDTALAVFQRLTGRIQPPSRPIREAWLAVGRRGGKGRFAALLAVFLACFRRHVLAPGEHGVVMVLATDRRQARVVFGYIAALIDAVPMLGALVTRRTRDSITLSNGVVIEVHTASFRAVRGYTILAVILDEVAFWRDDSSANPDAEIVAALRPAMATVPDALLIGISSPYARRGVLWDAFNEHFGKDDDRVLVVNADTLTMNPLVDPQIIADAFAADPVAAASEYGRDGSVVFRTDIEAFVSRDVLQACTVAGRFELPPASGLLYAVSVDPAGGSGSDSKTMAIAHPEVREDGLVIVVDAVREVKPPFSPEAVVSDFAALLHTYGVTTIIGDRWGGEWPREAFAKHGIVYELWPKPKSDVYRDVLPLLNSGRVELLDHRRLSAQFAALERRTARGGRDSIDHPPHSHDDLANAVALAILVAYAMALTRSTRGRPAKNSTRFARGAARVASVSSIRTWPVMTTMPSIRGFTCEPSRGNSNSLNRWLWRGLFTGPSTHTSRPPAITG
jgi:hypothetical protein